MPFTLVQKKTAASTSSGTSLSVTLSPAATAGNLLVACGNGDDFKASDPSGFTLAVGATDFTGTYIWYKVAAGGETTVTHTINSSTSIELAVYEYTLPLGLPLDVTASATHGDVTSATTGTTAATAQADELAVAMFGGFSGTGDITSWSNSFVEDDDLLSTGSTNNDRMWVAHKDLSATGTQTTTATFSATSSHPIGTIATFKSAAAAGGGLLEFNPGKTWKHRYKHRQILLAPAVTVADVRADTGLATVGLSADATTKKVAVVAAISSLGLSATSVAKKVSKSTGIGVAGLTATVTAKKAAPAAAIGTVGLSANFAHVEIHPITALATVGLTSIVTAKKLTPAVLNAPLGFAGIVTGKKVTPAALRSAVGLVGIVTARKITPATGRGVIGLQANFVHADIHPITALGALGLMSLVTEKKRLTPIVAGTLGLTGNALPKKISKSTGVGELPLVGLVIVGKKQAITGRNTIGLTAWWERTPPVLFARSRVDTGTTSAGVAATSTGRRETTGTGITATGKAGGDT